MHKVLIIGNPNVGKSTLFNSLTKSKEHTGNFHGVTVSEKKKIVNINNEEYEIYDLPGMYSLNSFSYEETVARDVLLKEKGTRLLLLDANSIRKNLYLCIQLNELNLDYKILINNYDYFKKYKNKINIEKLQNKLNKSIELINAKKIKINEKLLKISALQGNNNKINYLDKYLKIIKNKYSNLDEKTIIFALNGIFNDLENEQIEYIKSFYEDIIKDRYTYIDDLLFDCLEVNETYTYGVSKLDKFLLNPVVAILLSMAVFFLSIYLVFFLLGPLISDFLIAIVNLIIINPLANFICLITDNVWVIEFFTEGVLSSFVTILSFLPQVFLLFVLLTILEDSGLISRMAYAFDDFLSLFGLNGKAIYIMLLGLGCNTMSTMASRNMNGKNLKLKTALLNPYISCMARLPVFVIIATAFFGNLSYFVVAGLYLLGIIVALVMSVILDKTILKTENKELMLEFAPIRAIDIKHVCQEGIKNVVDMAKRIFTVVLSVSVIVWILTHTMFNLKYTSTVTDSVLFVIADKISWMFAPIGLNNAGIVCALIVGVMAKELIVSMLTITNSAKNVPALIASLSCVTSVVHFTPASAVSFLVFSLLYFPCASNIAVLKAETNRFWAIFACISQFTVAYLLSFVFYQAMQKGILFALIACLIISIIMFAIIFIIKKVKQGKCLTCGKCK